LRAYNIPDYRTEAQNIPRIAQFHFPSVILGTALIAAAVVYKKLLSSSPDVTLASIVPSAGFFHTARPFINWRAFSFTFFLILLISLLWEVTVGIPYGWWGYRPQTMLGLTLGKGGRGNERIIRFLKIERRLGRRRFRNNLDDLFSRSDELHALVIEGDAHLPIELHEELGMERLSFEHLAALWTGNWRMGMIVCGTGGAGRERFERELKRGRYCGRMVVVVEGSLSDVYVAGRGLHHNAITA
jgi:hypothetical protein